MCALWQQARSKTEKKHTPNKHWTCFEYFLLVRKWLSYQKFSTDRPLKSWYWEIPTLGLWFRLQTVETVKCDSVRTRVPAKQRQTRDSLNEMLFYICSSPITSIYKSKKYIYGVLKQGLDVGYYLQIMLLYLVSMLPQYATEMILWL